MYIVIQCSHKVTLISKGPFVPVLFMQHSPENFPALAFAMSVKFDRDSTCILKSYTLNITCFRMIIRSGLISRCRWFHLTRGILPVIYSDSLGRALFYLVQKWLKEYRAFMHNFNVFHDDDNVFELYNICGVQIHIW